MDLYCGSSGRGTEETDVGSIGDRDALVDLGCSSSPHNPSSKGPDLTVHIVNFSFLYLLHAKVYKQEEKTII